MMFRMEKSPLKLSLNLEESFHLTFPYLFQLIPMSLTEKVPDKGREGRRKKGFICAHAKKEEEEGDFLLTEGVKAKVKWSRGREILALFASSSFANRFFVSSPACLGCCCLEVDFVGTVGLEFAVAAAAAWYKEGKKGLRFCSLSLSLSFFGYPLAKRTLCRRQCCGGKAVYLSHFLCNSGPLCLLY